MTYHNDPPENETEEALRVGDPVSREWLKTAAVLIIIGLLGAAGWKLWGMSSAVEKQNAVAEAKAEAMKPIATKSYTIFCVRGVEWMRQNNGSHPGAMLRDINDKPIACVE